MSTRAKDARFVNGTDWLAMMVTKLQRSFMEADALRMQARRQQVLEIAARKLKRGRRLSGN